MENFERRDRLQKAIVALLPALHAFSKRFHRSQSDADDLVQETVAKALSHLEKFEEGTNLKSWLFTIMRNAFCSRFATAKREASGLAECVSDARTSLPSQDWAVLAKDVEAALGSLHSSYRGVIEEIVMNGNSYEDAALHFGCAVGTIKSRLNRARSQLISRFGSLSD